MLSARRCVVVGAAVLFATFGLSACGDDDSTSTSTTSTTASAGSSAATTKVVEIKDFAFSPATLEVNVGDTISVTNRDSVAHTLTADDGSFDTGMIQEGETKQITVKKAGTFGYYCKPHPNMRGEIKVS